EGKFEKQLQQLNMELKDIENLPSTLMICYLNGFEDAKNKLIEAKNFLKQHHNPEVYLAFKESMRILRKMKYNFS
ncbi:MAG: ATP-binding protein, partial [Flavobacterium sp.]|nr:ATP-binding protein [Flavobacterium sp.]